MRHRATLSISRSPRTAATGAGDYPCVGSAPGGQAGEPMDDSKARKVFARILKAATLAGRFSPNSLRHTFASLSLQAGESPAYVQRQLDHGSTKLTSDLYGKWLPAENKAAVDRLDDAVPAAPQSDAASTPAPTASRKTPRPTRRSGSVATGSQRVGAAAGAPRNYVP